MRDRRRPFLVVMIIIVVGQLLGGSKAAAAIKITGRLLIPIAKGKQRSYRGVLTITRAKIRVECDKKIFQPLNEFTAPKQKRLDIDTSELLEIEIDKDEKKIYLKVKKTFVSRYRNILNLEARHIHFSFMNGHVYIEFWAVIFAYEKPLNLSDLDKKVINSINNSVYPVYTKHFFYTYY